MTEVDCDYNAPPADILAPTTEAQALVDLGYSHGEIESRLRQRADRRRPRLTDHRAGA